MHCAIHRFIISGAHTRQRKPTSLPTVITQVQARQKQPYCASWIWMRHTGKTDIVTLMSSSLLQPMSCYVNTSKMCESLSRIMDYLISCYALTHQLSENWAKSTLLRNLCARETACIKCCKTLAQC